MALIAVLLAGATIMSYSKYKKSAADFAQAKADEESMRQRYDGAVSEIVMIQDSLNTIMLGGEAVLPEGRQVEEQPGTLHDTVLSRIAMLKASVERTKDRIEELDAKKYDPKDRLRQVARGLLPWLESLFPDSGCGPVPLNGPDDTTIEILLADRPRYRPSDADEEVLDVYHEVRLLAGRAKLVTADTGMRLRARAQEVDVYAMPPEYDRIQT